MNDGADRVLRVGPFEVRPAAGEIHGPAGTTRVEPKVMDVLLVLSATPGSVVSRQDLLQRVWGDVVVSEDALTAVISKLRRALQDGDRSAVETIPKRGYRLTLPVAGLEGAGHARTRSRKVPRSTVLLGALVLVILAVLLGRGLRSPDWAQPLQPPRPVTSLPGVEAAPCPAPGDARVVFARIEGGSSRLYVTDGAYPPTRLTRGDFSDRSPSWSPQGDRIAFLRTSAGASGLYVLVVASGAEERWVPGDGQRWGPGLDWSREGTNLAYSTSTGPDEPTAIVVLDVGSRASRRLSSPPAQVWGDRYPSFAPDGSRVAYVRTVTLGVSEIRSVDVRGERDRLIARVDGMIDGLDWLDDDRLVMASNHAGAWTLNTLDAGDGKLRAFGGPALNGRFPAVSFDFRRLVYTHHRLRADIWHLPLGVDPDTWRSEPPLIGSSFWDSTPQLSNDGQRMAWSSNRSGRTEIWTADVDGTGERKLTAIASAFSSAPRWSPDDRSLAFDTRVEGRARVGVLDLATGTVRMVGNPDADCMLPTWSLDGRQLYFNERLGELRALVRLPVEGGVSTVVAAGRAFLARERDGGSTLVYVDSNTHPVVMAKRHDERAQVVVRLPADQWGNWDVGEQGIYHVAERESGQVGIVRRSWQGGDTTLLARLEQRPENLALDVSTDERWLFVARVVDDESDIMELSLP